jgi:hypothetical protein
MHGQQAPLLASRSRHALAGSDETDPEKQFEQTESNPSGGHAEEYPEYWSPHSKWADSQRDGENATSSSINTTFEPLVDSVPRVRQPTESEIERGITALLPFAQEWGLQLNPEDL